MKKHSLALVLICTMALAACASTTLQKIKADIAQAQEIVSAVNEVAQSLPQCGIPAASASASAAAVAASVKVTLKP